MRRAITFLATGAYVGRLPGAPGTFGSLLALPAVAAFARLPIAAPVAVALVALASLGAMAVCERAGRELADPDSGEIVLDEVCGMLCAGLLLEPTPLALGLVFAFFRLFDVVKPFPARLLERRLRNGVGCVADDLVAGLYTNLVVRVLT